MIDFIGQFAVLCKMSQEDKRYLITDRKEIFPPFTDIFQNLGLRGFQKIVTNLAYLAVLLTLYIKVISNRTTSPSISIEVFKTSRDILLFAATLRCVF